jgi:hypothetical protein
VLSGSCTCRLRALAICLENRRIMLVWICKGYEMRICRFRCSSSLLTRLIGRGCVAETWSCLITHRLHRYPRPLLIQTCFRHQQAFQFLHRSSTHSRHQTVQSPHPKTRPFLPVLPYRTADSHLVVEYTAVALTANSSLRSTK